MFIKESQSAQSFFPTPCIPLFYPKASFNSPIYLCLDLLVSTIFFHLLQSSLLPPPQAHFFIRLLTLVQSTINHHYEVQKPNSHTWFFPSSCSVYTQVLLVLPKNIPKHVHFSLSFYTHHIKLPSSLSDHPNNFSFPALAPSNSFCSRSQSNLLKM